MRTVRWWLSQKPTVERTQGEWLWSDNRWGLGEWLCNKCEHYAPDKSKVCPNCGAKMILEKNNSV